MSDKPASRTRGAKRRRDDTESLRQDYECPVCMELPAGAVHRCAKGHRICGACDERLFRSAIAIGLESSPSGGCVSRGDVIIVEDTPGFTRRCMITRMYKWDEKAEDEKAEGESE